MTASLIKLSFQPSSTVSYSYMTYNLTNWAGGYLDLDTGVFTAETPVSRQNDKSLFLRNEKVFISRAPTVFPGATRVPQAVFGSIGEGRESPRLTSRISCSRFFPIWDFAKTMQYNDCPPQSLHLDPANTVESQSDDGSSSCSTLHLCVALSQFEQ